METVILVVHVVAALAVIGLILMQQGKGADAGASFGGGASQTVFGSQGSASFLSRLTAVLATVFFITSFALAMVAANKATDFAGVGIPQIPVVQEQAAELPVTETPITSDAPVLDAGSAAPSSDAPVTE